MQSIVNNNQILNNFLSQGDCVCDWNRRTKSFSRDSFDSKKFWMDLAHLKNEDKSCSETDTLSLYRERTISLGKENDPSFVLRLGINSKYLFNFVCFVNDVSKKNKKSVHLNANQLSKVFDELRNINTTTFSAPSRYKHVTKSDVKGFSENKEFFEIRTQSQSIWMDERSIKKFLRMQPFIKRYISLLNKKSVGKHLFTHCMFTVLEKNPMS